MNKVKMLVFFKIVNNNNNNFDSQKPRKLATKYICYLFTCFSFYEKLRVWTTSNLRPISIKSDKNHILYVFFSKIR